MRSREHCPQLLVEHAAEPAPGRAPRRPEGLGLPQVPDPGDEPLTEEGVADGPVLPLGPQVPEHGVEIGRLGEDVRPQTPSDAAVELEHGSAPEHRRLLVAAEDEPRRPEQRTLAREHPPPALHPKVAAEDEAAVEPKQEILPDRLDALEPPAVQQRGELLHRRPRMRCLDLERLPDEHLQTARVAMEGVTLGHPSQSSGPRTCVMLLPGTKRLAAALNISALARRTGIAADTLRKWEQRYGIIRPTRTTGGQRRYSERDVARVEWLRDRLAEGYRISAAAALLGQTAEPAGRTPARSRA